MLTSTLALIGGLTVAAFGYRACKVVLHLTRSSQLSRYLHGEESWALFTGASDGIGYGYVEELASRGFDIILHGRNVDKLDGCIKQLQLKYPTRQFRKAVLDAAVATSAQVDQLVANLPENVTVLVNNVGTALVGPVSKYTEFQDRSTADIEKIINTNEVFPTLLTRALLPKFIANQPALIINIGSVLDTWPCVYLEEYCGGKAHNRAFSYALRKNMELNGWDIEVLYHRVMSAATTGSQSTVSFTNVSPRLMAAGALGRVCCSEGETLGPARHEIMIGLFQALVPGSSNMMGAMASGAVGDKIRTS